MKLRRRIITPLLATFSLSLVVLGTVYPIWGAGRGQPPAASSPKPASAKPVVSAEVAAQFQTKIVPMLKEYCYECHGNGNKKGDVALDSYKTISDIEKDKGVWEEVIKDVHAAVMPIATAKKKPSQTERNMLTDWVQSVLYPFDPNHPNPGRVTLHRLNRSEYNNTIHDLLAIDFKPADAFPVDDAGYGFDNNGDVLSIAPILMEKYIDAAGTALDRAIFADPILPPPSKRWEAATMEGTLPKSDPKAALVNPGPSGRTSLLGRVLNYNADIYVDYEFPADGEYVLRLNSYGKQRPMVQFKIDGVDVGGQVAIPQDLPNVGVYGTTKFKAAAGKHTITMSLVNGASKGEYDAAVAAAAIAATQPATAPAATAPATQAVALGVQTPPNPPVLPAAATPDPTPTPGAASATPPGAPANRAGAAANRAGANRAGANRAGAGAAVARAGRGGPPSITGKPTVGVIYVEVEGPQALTPERMPESYRRVMVAQPSATVTKAQAAEKIIRNFAYKAYRRPVTEDEVKDLMALWSKEDAGGEKFEAAIHTTLQAVLVSPNFLYRYESDPTAKDADGVRPINEYELASRLSYFLWSTMPDDELFNLAKDGKLRANLQAQVKRMMASPKSMALVENFAGQWLQIRKMGNVVPDPTKFKDFDEPLRDAMIKETQLYFAEIMQKDRSVIDFLDSDFTYMNERLAKHYGRTDVKGDAFQRVALTGTQRGGLLTQASVLTITSYATRTSPVQRGKWVLENLLDSAPPPPPPDVPKLVETEQAELTGTLRQRMEQHRTNPNCITCHSQMDPIGFGLENYDAIGAWRDRDVNNEAIDATGTLPDGSAFNGAAGLRTILKASKDQFTRCLTDRMLTYALGRGTEVYDRPLEDKITAGLKKNDYKFSALINQIVESDAFQKRGTKRGDE